MDQKWVPRGRFSKINYFEENQNLSTRIKNELVVRLSNELGSLYAILYSLAYYIILYIMEIQNFREWYFEEPKKTKCSCGSELWFLLFAKFCRSFLSPERFNISFKCSKFNLESSVICQFNWVLICLFKWNSGMPQK